MMKTSFAVLMMLLDLSSSQSCLFHEEMLCNGEVFVTLNYHRQVRPCPCVIIASSAPCDDRNLCIDVLFDDDSMKCVEWTSYPPGYEYYGKNETTACFNSSSVVGRTIKLICRIHHVDSDPPLDIIFKGPQDMSCPTPDTIMCTDSNSLVNISIHPEGVTVSNSGSSNDSPSLLPQICALSIPREFESKVLDPFSISVFWKEPETDGGWPVIRYDLNITEAVASESKLVQLSASRWSHTFTDLNQDTTYIISIRAVNRDSETGDEQSSLAVELVNTTLPVGPPQIPAQLQSSLVTNVSVRISWTDPGGYPDNYTLEIKLNVDNWTSPDVIRVTGLTSLSHDQDGLVPLSRYEARMLSINFNGPSDFSELALFNTVGMILVGGGADKVDNTLEATTGETVTLTCTLSQLKEEEVAVNYTWTRGDGKPLPDDSQETRGVLTITGARTEDSGMYVCSANGVEGVFSLSVVEIASDESEVITTITNVLTVVAGMGLLIFFVVEVLTVYCVCFHGDKVGESPHYHSCYPKHWVDASRSHSMLRERV